MQRWGRFAFGDLQPHVQLAQAGQIAPPVAAHPSQALAEVLLVVFQRRLHLALAVVLQLYLPVVREQPSRDEVVVVGIQEVVASPRFVGEAVGEVWILQDFRAVGDCPPRQTGKPAVEPIACRTVKGPPHKVDGTQELPDVVSVLSAELLVRSHAADACIFKRCQHPFVEFLRQPHVVVQQQCDLSSHLWDCSGKLASFVGLAYRQHLDLLGAAHLFHHLVQSLHARVGSHEQQLKWLETVRSLNSFFQLLDVFGNGWDDDGNIFRGNAGLIDRLYGRISPNCR